MAESKLVDTQSQEPKKRSLVMAVIQLESHPAVSIEDNDYLSEPFIEGDGSSLLLSDLVRFEEADDIKNLQNHFRDAYLTWAKKRLSGILKHLEGFEGDSKPMILFFPEFSVPFRHLEILRKSVLKNNWIVVAGNHAFNRDPKAYHELFSRDRFVWGPHREFDKIEIGIPAYKGIYGNRQLPPKSTERGANSVLVIMEPGETGSINVSARFKRKLSPFEFTSGHFESEQSNVVTKESPEWICRFKQPEEFSLQVFLCAEALQGNTADSEAEVIAICAYHSRPEDFDRIMDPAEKVQKIALLASDGRFGQSTIRFNFDRRPKSWWHKEPSRGVLPLGDSILIYKSVLPPRFSPLGASNPYKEEKLVHLAAVTCGDENDDHFLVSRELQRLDRRIESLSDGQVARMLENIQHRYSGSLIQRTKLRYLIRLGAIGKLNSAVLKAVGSDCNFGRSTQSVDEDNANNISLRQLEKNFAAETHAWLRHKIEAGGLPPRTSAECVRVQTRCLEFFRPDTALGPVPAANRFLKRIKREAKRKAFANLNHLLGTIIERFGATSGWIFLRREKSLVEFISQNVPLKSRHLRFPLDEDWFTRDKRLPDKCGLTVYSLIHAEGVLENDVRNGPFSRYYKPSISETRSEICVPIFSTSGESIGVLNLEADEEWAFSQLQIGELQAASWQLLPDLLIAKAQIDLEDVGGWHPDLNGWGLDSLLSELCDGIATSLLETDKIQSLSCTIWHADWQKACLYVRGTARFNFEYVSQRLMPLQYDDESLSDLTREPPSVPPHSWIHGKVSFTAKVAASSHGTVEKGLISQYGDYSRKDKANRMGVEYIISTPIYEPAELGEKASLSSGVLSLYFFRRQQPKHEFSIAGSFPDPVIVWLADTVGAILRDVKSLRQEVAHATLFSRLFDDGIPFVNYAEHLLETCRTSLEADGVSVFRAEVADPEENAKRWETSFKTICSTGFSSASDDNRNASMNCFSDFSSVDQKLGNWMVVKGMTGMLAAIPGAVVRKIDIPDLWEAGNFKGTGESYGTWMKRVTGSDDAHPYRCLLEPRNTRKEKTEPTDTEHRRFVGASTSIDNDSSGVGVVRCVRGPGARPFVNADADLLAKLTRSFAPFFANEGLVIEPPNLENFDVPISDMTWNRRFLDSILQIFLSDINLKMKNWAGEVRFSNSNLHHVCRGVGGLPCLRIFASQSGLTRQEELESDSTVLYESTSLSEWQAIVGNEIIWIDCTRDDSSRTGRFRICIPYTIDSFHARADSVLAISGENGNAGSIKNVRRMLQSLMPSLIRLGRLMMVLRNTNAPKRCNQAEYGSFEKGFSDAIFADESKLAQVLGQFGEVREVDGGDDLENFLWYGPIKLLGMPPQSGFITNEIFRKWHQMVLGIRFSKKLVARYTVKSTVGKNRYTICTR